jgi:peptidoglycan/LPS O-acetylase OafA/YrhL
LAARCDGRGHGALIVHYHGLSEVDVLTETIGFTCLALGFAATVSLALDTPRQPTLVGGFFRNPTLRVLGKYSYAMYCVHPLIQDLLRAAGIDAARMPMVRGLVLPGVAAYGVLVLTLTFGISYASWHLMEKHFLGLKARFTDGGEPH